MPGKRSLAMESFAAALRAIPATICDNAGAKTGCSLPSQGSGRGRLRAGMLGLPWQWCVVHLRIQTQHDTVHNNIDSRFRDPVGPATSSVKDRGCKSRCVAAHAACPMLYRGLGRRLQRTCGLPQMLPSGTLSLLRTQPIGTLRPKKPCNPTLAAGLDSADLVSQLRAAHAHDPASRLGVDVLSGGAGDMDKLGIFESFKVTSSDEFLHVKGWNPPASYASGQVGCWGSHWGGSGSACCRAPRPIAATPLGRVTCIWSVQKCDMEEVQRVAAQVKAAVLLSATEAAEMILRVDDIIKCAPRKRNEE